MHSSETPIGYPTPVAVLMCSKLYTLHNLHMYDLRPPITVHMTIKGSQRSISYYTKINCVWDGCSEEQILDVASRRDLHIIFELPSIRHTKAVINIETMKVVVQPLACQKFTLYP